MGWIEITGGVLLIISCILIILTISLQESKGGGLNAVSGANDSYLGKNQGRTFDAMLVRVTKILGIVFVVLTIAVYALNAYLPK